MGFRTSAANNARLQCSVRGCTKHRSGVGRWCEAHTCRSKFHGSPQQYPVRPELLREYEKMTNRYFRRHHHPSDASRTAPECAVALAEANDILSLGREPEPVQYEGRRWHAPGTLKGQATAPRWFAWREVHRLLNPPPSADRRALSGVAARNRTVPRRRPEPVSPIEVLRATLPLFLASEMDPPLFNDVGLTFALGGAVCDLRPHAVRWTAWDDKAQKQETALRRPGAKARRYIGEMVRDHLGLWFYTALAQIRLDEKDRAERRDAYVKARQRIEAQQREQEARRLTANPQPQPQPQPQVAAPKSAWLDYLNRKGT